mgnify:CR=1 FL=1
MTNADLTNADLINADISDATLTGATLTGATFSNTIFNDITPTSLITSDDYTITTNWKQIGSSISGESYADTTNCSISLSGNGTIVAIGSYNSNNRNGQVNVYEYASSVWTKLGDTINNTHSEDYFGYSVSLNSAGTIVAIGAPYGNSDISGKISVYKYVNSAWTQIGSDITGSLTFDRIGNAVTLNSSSTISGDIIVSSISGNGLLQTYKYNSTWTQLGSNIQISDGSTYSITSNSNNTIVAIGVQSSDPGYTNVYKYENSAWAQYGSTILGNTSRQKWIFYFTKFEWQ